MGKIIVFASGSKGGVGKSVLSVNLAGALAHKGYSVALVDTDTGNKEDGSQGSQSVTTFARQRAALIEDGHDLPEITAYQFSHGDKIHSQLKDIATAKDFVIMDTPGAASTALRSAVAVADIIFLPINMSRDEFLPLPQVFDLISGVEDMLSGVGINKQIDVRILPTRIVKNWKSDLSEFIEWYQIVGANIASVSRVSVPHCVPLSKTCSYGLCLHDEKNKYRGHFDLLIDEILGKRSLLMIRGSNLEMAEG